MKYLKSWKTTFCALLVCLGYLGDKLQRHVVMPEYFSSLCSVLFVVGLVGIGLFARDHDKSSEDAGIK